MKEQVAFSFMLWPDTKEETGTVYKITNKNTRSQKPHAVKNFTGEDHDYAQEEEMLYPIGATFQITSITKRILKQKDYTYNDAQRHYIPDGGKNYKLVEMKLVDK